MSLELQQDRKGGDRMSWQREELFKQLVEKTEVLGRKVTFDEFDQDENLPKANSFAYYYGSFDVAAQEAWDKVRGEQKIRAECEVKEMEVRPVSKKKQQIQMSEERKERVIDEFVKMYIDRDGEMPSTRMVKKNPYITEEEVNVLRMCGELTEPKVRRQAEKQSGKKFLTPEERRVQKMKERYGCKSPSGAETRTEQVVPKVVSVPEVKVEVEKVEPVTQEVVEPKTEVKEMGKREHYGRGHGVSKEDVLNDLKALTERLGHLPTASEIQNAENGTKYSYPTYVRKLGPKSGWAELLELDEAGEPEVAEEEAVESEVVEVEAEDAVEVEAEAETVTVTKVVPELIPEEKVAMDTTEMKIIEFPVKVIIPKWVKGTVSVTLELV